MARHKHIRNPHDYPIDFPTLIPALHLEPGQVARVPSDIDVPGVEIVTAKDVTEDNDGPPPQSGRGSGLQAWQDYAAAHHVDVPGDAGREQIIAALTAAAVPVEGAESEVPLHTLDEPEPRIDDPWVGAPATVLSPEPAPELPATATIEEPTP